MTTFGYEYEWAEILPSRVASHRATTSSRRPGQVFRGVVYVDAADLRRCSRCGSLARGEHPARHFWARRGAQVAWFDCVGNLTELVPL